MFKKNSKPHSAYDSFIKLQSVRNSELARLLLSAVLIMWAYNGWSVYQEYKNDVKVEIATAQNVELGSVAVKVESVMRLVYEHIRMISLLPSIRRVGEFNRISADENVVDQGRLSIDTHQTIQQIYRNLNNTVDLSEIYVSLKGFDPDAGEVPFAMYDDAVSGVGRDSKLDFSSDHFSEIEYEMAEYQEYVKQLNWFTQTFPEWLGKNDITKIPALTSPLLRTCDVTQFDPSQENNFQNTLGMVYSVPIFSLADQKFIGIVSAVLRANILESILAGLPFIPVTATDIGRFSELGLTNDGTPSNFVLTNDNGVQIFDRRNTYLADRIDGILAGSGSDYVSTTNLDVVSDVNWTLYNYMTQEDIVSLVKDRTIRFYRDIAIRVLLMVVFAVMLIKALRDQTANHRNLVRLAHFDSLTELPNRAMLYSALEQAIKRADRQGTRIGLLFLDVDDFGIINDSTSHSVGDLVLQNIANRLRTQEGGELVQAPNSQGYVSNPLVARLGGDDFALIFEELPSAELALVLGQLQVDKFNEPMLINGQVMDVALSGGMAIYPDDADDYHQLMANVDYTLKNAMDMGSGHFLMFTDEMRQQAARANRLLRDIPDAIRNSAFTLQYQPKQSLDTDRVLSFEALIRWNHPEFGNVSPTEFVPLLEQTNNIVEVGRWVMAESCRQLKSWKDRGYIDICVSVNVSAKQLLLSDIVLTLDSILDEFDLAPNKLILEITESLMINNLHESSSVLDRIRERGVKLAIDDFGTGYSSLTYLQGLPVDYLKLDKSMIDVIHDKRGAHVTKATIDLAHGLGMLTIAEGVEHLSQRDLLKSMGCDMIQGYLLSRPLSPEDLDPFLNLSRVQTTDDDSAVV